MKRSGCLEGCFLLTVGGFVVAIAAAIAIPGFVTVKVPPVLPKLRTNLKEAYKECAYHLARYYNDLPVRELSLAQWAKNTKQWKVFDLKTGGQLDLNVGFNKTKVLGRLVEAQYGKLAYGLDLDNGDKSCITRSGEEREDWSCE